jgi:hypothetical protein
VLVRSTHGTLPGRGVSRSAAWDCLPDRVGKVVYQIIIVRQLIEGGRNRLSREEHADQSGQQSR